MRPLLLAAVASALCAAPALAQRPDPPGVPRPDPAPAMGNIPVARPRAFFVGAGLALGPGLGATLDATLGRGRALYRARAAVYGNPWAAGGDQISDLAESALLVGAGGRLGPNWAIAMAGIGSVEVERSGDAADGSGVGLAYDLALLHHTLPVAVTATGNLNSRASYIAFGVALVLGRRPFERQ